MANAECGPVSAARLAARRADITCFLAPSRCPRSPEVQVRSRKQTTPKSISTFLRFAPVADPRQLTDPAFFSRLENLELRARGIVEGFMHGLHRSPFVGFSVEFAAHREYVQGDDLRHVNWKLYSRTNRLYVKQFDAETNMNLYLLLDVSGSMDWPSKGGSKLGVGGGRGGGVG